jgi:antibiotic biosynthesis monooxygenase (ABM) superfamily enzyme
MPELAAMIAAASLGAMVFFSAVVAPTVFKVLPEASARQLLRALFPQYFLVNGLVALVAGVIAWRALESVLVVASGVLLLVLRYVAVPIINAARDAMLAGQSEAASRFARWHRGSVILNVGELLVLSVAVWLLLGAHR